MEEAKDKNHVQEIPKEYADIFPAEVPDELLRQRGQILSIKLTDDSEPCRSGIFLISQWKQDELKTQLPTRIQFSFQAAKRLTLGLLR